MIALFAILLMVSSAMLNYLLIVGTGEHELSGRATNGKVEMCNNRGPSLLFNCPGVLTQGENYQCDVDMFDYECDESCLVFDAGSSSISGTSIQNIAYENRCARSITLESVNLSWRGSQLVRAISIDGADIWTEAGPGSPSGQQTKDAEINPVFTFSGNSNGIIDYIDFNAVLDMNEKIRLFMDYGNTQKQIEIIYHMGNYKNSFTIQYCSPAFAFTLNTKNPLKNLFYIDSSSGLINVTIPITPDDRYQRNNPYEIMIYGDDSVGCSNSIDSGNYSLIVIQDNHPPYFTVYSPSNTQFNITETDNRTFYARVRDVDNEDNDTSNDNNLTFSWYINGVLVQNYTDTNYEQPFNMYKYSTNYTSEGKHTIFLTVYDGIFTIDKTWTVTVLNLNRDPFFNKSIDNQTWQENRFKAAFFLDEYVIEYDEDDTFTFEPIYLDPAHSIIATIDTENRNQVIFSQPRGWFGKESIRFRVIDNHGGIHESNNISLEVKEEPLAQTQASGGGGGGGGGGASSSRCTPNWFCGNWEHCQPNGFMERLCYDLNECGEEKGKPLEVSPCKYLESCMNGRLDQGEEGVDCGGPCPPCGNCYDKKKNNGETGIDCGGPCDPCPTCFDGIWNQGEMQTDCGGPCDPCPSCTDGILNQGETDVDCGGPCGDCPFVERPMSLIGLSGSIKEHLISPFSTSIAIGTIAGVTLIVLFYKNMIGLFLLFYKPFKKKKQYSQFIEKQKQDEIDQKRILINLEKDDVNDPVYLIHKLSDLKQKIFYDLIGIDTSLPIEEQIIQLKKSYLSKDAQENIIELIEVLKKVSYSGEDISDKDCQNLFNIGSTLLKEMKKSENLPELRFSQDYEDADYTYMKKLVVECKLLIKGKKKKEAIELYKKISEQYDSTTEAVQEKMFATLDKLYLSIKKLEK
jgi:hypothetical protein